MNEWVIWLVHRRGSKNPLYEEYGGASSAKLASELVRRLREEGKDVVYAPPGFVPAKNWQW